MESFFHTLKTELVHHQHYATREQAKRDIFAYIEGFLQSNASPLGHRISQPDRDGAKSSLSLSIFSGEDQHEIVVKQRRLGAPLIQALKDPALRKQHYPPLATGRPEIAGSRAIGRFVFD
jgi:Integrase core domain